MNYGLPPPLFPSPGAAAQARSVVGDGFTFDVPPMVFDPAGREGFLYSTGFDLSDQLAPIGGNSYGLPAPVIGQDMTERPPHERDWVLSPQDVLDYANWLEQKRLQFESSLGVWVVPPIGELPTAKAQAWWKDKLGAYRAWAIAWGNWLQQMRDDWTHRIGGWSYVHQQHQELKAWVDSAQTAGMRAGTVAIEAPPAKPNGGWGGWGGIAGVFGGLGGMVLDPAQRAAIKRGIEQAGRDGWLGIPGVIVSAKPGEISRASEGLRDLLIAGGVAAAGVAAFVLVSGRRG